MNKYYVTCDLEETIDQLNLWINMEELDLYEIRENLKNILDDTFESNITEIIYFQDILDYFQERKQDDEIIISLDNGIYVKNADLYFNSTRMYYNQKDIINNPSNYKITQRDGNPIENQIKKIKEIIDNNPNKNIVICDDGIFSWDTINEVIKIVKAAWWNVKTIRVVLNFSKNKHLNGSIIESLQSPDDCIDWIDERDFFHGVGMSGASVQTNKGIVGIAYNSSKEIAEKKASIPSKKSLKFCKQITSQNIRLWEQINNSRKKCVELWDLPRLAYLKNRYIDRQDIISILENENSLSLFQSNIEEISELYLKIFSNPIRNDWTYNEELKASINSKWEITRKLSIQKEKLLNELFIDSKPKKWAIFKTIKDEKSWKFIGLTLWWEENIITLNKEKFYLNKEELDILSTNIYNITWIKDNEKIFYQSHIWILDEFQDKWFWKKILTSFAEQAIENWNKYMLLRTRKSNKYYKMIKNIWEVVYNVNDNEIIIVVPLSNLI